MSLKINTRDKFLYEHLTFIINEFEKAALSSETREGIAVTSLHALQSMDQVLNSSSKALKMNRTKSVNREQNSSTESFVTVEENPQEGIIPMPPDLNVNMDQLSQKQELVGGEDALVNLSAVEFDTDLQNATGEDNLKDYLEECFGCDLRLTFDWQLKPIDLLSAIKGLVAEINAGLDSLLSQLNPLNFLKNLCDLLNGFNWMCPKDLIAILMALKLLLKKYLTFQLKINLDWTALLAPLLKLILDALASLIQAIAGVLVGPLDCVLAALKTIADLEKALFATLEVGIQVAQRAEDRLENGADVFDFDTLWKDIGVEEGEAGSSTLSEEGILNLVAPTPPSLKSETNLGTEENPSWTQWSFPSGAQLGSDVKLPDALKDPRFGAAHWTSKVILAVQEAKDYILDLVRKIIGSLNSLEGLVSGSLSIQVGNLGMLLFIKDMITLVLLIRSLLKSNIGIKDWCAEFQAHPEILQEALSSVGRDLKVAIKDTNLILSKGPEILGVVNTCASDSQDPKITQWIKELKNGL